MVNSRDTSFRVIIAIPPVSIPHCSMNSVHSQCAQYPLPTPSNCSMISPYSVTLLITLLLNTTYCLLPTPYPNFLLLTYSSEVHRPHSWEMGAAPGQRLIFSYTALLHLGVHCRPVICLIQLRPVVLPTAGIGHGGGLRVNVSRLSQASGL